MPGTLGLCGGLTALAPTCTGAWMPYLRQAGNVLFFFFRETCIKASAVLSDLQGMFQRTQQNYHVANEHS